MVIWIGLGIAVLAGIYAIWLYNRLVAYRQRTREAWSDILVQMQRRYDLIPNLVETVKGYAAHEKTTLDEVVAARNAAVAQTGTPDEQATAEATLNGALAHVFALSENYPDLKASANFQDLQHELSDSENRIQSARRHYNGSVKALNTAIESFPGNIVAGLFHFTPEPFFELEAGTAAEVERPVGVSF
ncbi:LemA family protein [Chachezhania sediminis]|uniref:LemA family protein n=1 Tax=Chachezhania sediminis TaxID=2599291 RepID=UPI00131DFAFE|nr:LemA family protein [Chachezhania sediminis]